jgi:hypothetical protein
VNTDDPDHPGSGKIVKAYSCLCEGDVEPSTNKKIKLLIDAEDEYIVFLDEEGWIWWSIIRCFEYPDGYADVANKIADLETLSTDPLSVTDRFQFGRMLGEAMARFLGDRDKRSAFESIDLAKAFLNARGSQNARGWYLGISMYAGLFLVIVLGLVLSIRARLEKDLGITGLDVTVGILCGAVGSAFFVLIRSKMLKLDATLGPKLHKMESLARLMVGGFSGLILALLIRSGEIALLSNSAGVSMKRLMLFCFVAGYSERWLPSWIKSTENSVNAQG